MLRKVTNPPGLVHVTRAADLSNSDYLTVSRYSRTVTAELVLGTEEELGEDAAEGIAWHAAALLKLTAAPALLCPASSTVSWDALSAVRDNSVRFRVLDDAPRRILLDSDNRIGDETARWVSDHLENALYLRGKHVSRRFGLAFNIAYTWNLTDDPRVAIANAWFGLEAMFGDQADRRHRSSGQTD